jgi:hypothetical protein
MAWLDTINDHILLLGFSITTVVFVRDEAFASIGERERQGRLAGG